MTRSNKILLNTVLGEKQSRPPMWVMRQAGRYLPEYREIRAEAGGFLNLCYNPKFATEVTLQPLKRFDLDAAILFSDILVIPDALGQKVAFETGEGPVLTPVTPETIPEFDSQKVLKHLAPVLETVSSVRAGLGPEKTLIGFCGSPWTVATYMIGGRGSPDQAKARIFALEQPKAFAQLMDVLVETSVEYLVAQLKAGADVIQLFESWAMNIDEISFSNNVIAPNKRIVDGVRARVENAPIIGFPRGAAGLVAKYALETGVDMVGLDHSMPLAFANEKLPENFGVQGNLDPLRLAVGGSQMEERAHEIIEAFAHRPHIFNLGHGIIPQTPIENMARLVDFVKGRN